MAICKPDFVLRRPWELDPEALTQAGVGGVLLDLDNTLVPYGYEGPVPDAVAAWLGDLKARGIAAALVTNARPGRTRRWGEKLGVPALPLAAKPLPFGIYWGARVLGVPRARLLLVGDQVFTDLLGGKLAGVKTALVLPLAPHELPHTRWLRRLERRCRSLYNGKDSADRRREEKP